ncbi:MAG TPA: DUF3021 family protein [Bacteroidetes bacterium]|nr:DUF3021 family protein [Bacteroidota bacterium]
MKRNIITGIGFGAAAGIIDVIPMIIQNLTWDANISSFLMWVVIGFILSIVELKMNSILKGFLISYLILLPAAILIGWKEPVSLVPIIIMTTILGGALGYLIYRLKNKDSK